MADQVNANINIDIDSSAAISNLRKLETQINQFQRSINAANTSAVASQAAWSRQLLQSINATGQFNAKIVDVQDSVSRFSRTLEKNKFTLGEYTRLAASQMPGMSRVFRKEFDTIQQVAESRVKSIASQFVALRDTIDGTTRAIAITPTGLAKGYNTDIAIATERQKIFNKLIDDGSTKLLNWGKNTQWAGRQLMVGFSIPLAALGTVAAKTFMEIDKANLALRRVYGDLSTTTAEVDSNIEAIQNLGKAYTKYGISLAETTGIAARAAATGAQNETLLAATEETLRFATLGQIDYNQALDSTIALQTAFGVSNDQLASKIDFLNAVENQTILTIDDMSLAIPRVATVVKGLGGDVEDLAVMMTAMREGGVSAENAANALKSGLASLINPTKRARESLAGMNIDIKAMVNANKGDLMGLITDFANATNALDEFSRQQVFEQVFGKYQYARMSALFTNITKDAGQAARAMELAGMSAQELAAISERELTAISDTTSVKFQAALETLKIEIAPIGEAFLKGLTPIIELASKLLDAFNNLPDGVKNAVAVTTAIVGGLGPVFLMLAGLVGNGVANIVKGVQFMRRSIARIRGDAEAFNYLSDAENTALLATEKLQGGTVELTSKLLLQRRAVDSLTAAYSRFTRVAGTAGGAMAAVPAGGGGGGGKPAMVQPRRFESGGTVPGTGNKDTIPALLTPGESVITKQATQQYGPIIDAMNEGRLPGFNKGVTGVQYFGNNSQTGPGGKVKRPKIKVPNPPLMKPGEIHRSHMAGMQSQVLPDSLRSLIDYYYSLPARINGKPNEQRSYIGNTIISMFETIQKGHVLDIEGKRSGTMAQASNYNVSDSPSKKIKQIKLVMNQMKYLNPRNYEHINIARSGERNSYFLEAGLSDHEAFKSVSNIARGGEALTLRQWEEQVQRAESLLANPNRDKIVREMATAYSAMGKPTSPEGILQGAQDLLKENYSLIKRHGKLNDEIFIQSRIEDMLSSSHLSGTKSIDPAGRKFVEKKARTIMTELRDNGLLNDFISKKISTEQFIGLVSARMFPEKMTYKKGRSPRHRGGKTWFSSFLLSTDPRNREGRGLFRDAVGGQSRLTTIPQTGRNRRSILPFLGINWMNGGGNIPGYNNGGLIQYFSNSLNPVAQTAALTGKQKFLRRLLESWVGKPVSMDERAVTNILRTMPGGAEGQRYSAGPLYRGFYAREGDLLPPRVRELINTAKYGINEEVRQAAARELVGMEFATEPRSWTTDYDVSTRFGSHTMELPQMEGGQFGLDVNKYMPQGHFFANEQEFVPLEESGRRLVLRISSVSLDDPSGAAIPSGLSGEIPEGSRLKIRVERATDLSNTRRRRMERELDERIIARRGSLLGSRSKEAKAAKRQEVVNYTGGKAKIRDEIFQWMQDIESGQRRYNSWSDWWTNSHEEMAYKLFGQENFREFQKAIDRDEWPERMPNIAGSTRRQTLEIIRKIREKGIQGLNNGGLIQYLMSGNIVRPTRLPKPVVQRKRRYDASILDDVQEFRAQIYQGDLEPLSMLLDAGRNHPNYDELMKIVNTSLNIFGRDRSPNATQPVQQEWIDNMRKWHFDLQDYKMAKFLDKVAASGEEELIDFFTTMYPTYVGNKSGRNAEYDDPLLSKALAAIFGPQLFKNKGGIIPRFENGGDVYAAKAFASKPIFESANKTYVPGSGNTDTVPAMLTPGEFVINKQATAENLPLLQAINSGEINGFNKGGKIPGIQYFGWNPIAGILNRQRVVQKSARQNTENLLARHYQSMTDITPDEYSNYLRMIYRNDDNSNDIDQIIAHNLPLLFDDKGRTSLSRMYSDEVKRVQSVGVIRDSDVTKHYGPGQMSEIAHMKNLKMVYDDLVASGNRSVRNMSFDDFLKRIKDVGAHTAGVGTKDIHAKFDKEFIKEINKRYAKMAYGLDENSLLQMYRGETGGQRQLVGERHGEQQLRMLKDIVDNDKTFESQGWYSFSRNVGISFSGERGTTPTVQTDVRVRDLPQVLNASGYANELAMVFDTRATVSRIMPEARSILSREYNAQLKAIELNKKIEKVKDLPSDDPRKMSVIDEISMLNEEKKLISRDYAALAKGPYFSLHDSYEPQIIPASKINERSEEIAAWKKMYPETSKSGGLLKFDPDAQTYQIDLDYLNAGKIKPGDIKLLELLQDNLGISLVSQRTGSGLQPIKLNNGNIVPGMGDTDTVPAMLTPGEFVINKQSTQRNLPLLHAINNGENIMGMNKGGRIPGVQYFQNAGEVDPYRTERSHGTMPRYIDVNDPIYKETKKVSSDTAFSQTPKTIKAFTNWVFDFPRIFNKALQTGTMNPKELQKIFSSRRTVNRVMRPIITAIAAQMGVSRRDLQKNPQFRRMVKDFTNNLNTAFGSMTQSVIGDKEFSKANAEAIDKAIKSSGVNSDISKAVGRAMTQVTAIQPIGNDGKPIGSGRVSIPKSVQESVYGQGRYTPSYLRGEAYSSKLPSGRQLPNWMKRLQSIGITEYREAIPQSRSTSTRNVTSGLHPSLQRLIATEKTPKGRSSLPGIVDRDELRIRESMRSILKQRGLNLDILESTKSLTAQRELLAARSEAIKKTQQPIASRIPQSQVQEESMITKRTMKERMAAFGQRAGAGMGALGMGISMASMLPAMAADEQGNFMGMNANTAMMGLMGGGTALSMLPMFLSPTAMAPVMAGLAAFSVVGVSLYAFRKSIDDASKEAAKMGANMGGTANALNTIGKLLGKETPVQRQAQATLGFNQQQQEQAAAAFGEIFASEPGQKFIKDLESATSAERFTKLRDYLQNAIASGMMDQKTAQLFAKTIASSLSDPTIGISLMKSISSQRTGSTAMLELAKSRESAVASNILNTKTRTRPFGRFGGTPIVETDTNVVDAKIASASIASSMQLIQDFSNAAALAKEELIAGKISYSQYRKVIDESTIAQQKYTEAINQAFQRTSDFGTTLQAWRDQLLLSGKTPEIVDLLQGSATKEVKRVEFGQIRATIEELFSGQTSIGELFKAATTGTVTTINKDLLAAVQGAVGAGQMSDADIAALATEIQTNPGGRVAQAFNRTKDFQMAGLEMMLQQGQIPGLKTLSSQFAYTQAAQDFRTAGFSINDLNQIMGLASEGNAATMAFELKGLSENEIESVITNVSQLSEIIGPEGMTKTINILLNEDPPNLEDRLPEVERNVRLIAENIPDDVQKRLGIAIDSPYSAGEWGPLAKDIGSLIPILDRLPDGEIRKFGIDLMLNQNGEPKELSQYIKDIEKMGKSFSKLSSKSQKVRKEGIIEFLTIAKGPNGETIENPAKAYDDLRKLINDELGEGKFEKLPPDTYIKMISIQSQVVGLEQEIEKQRLLAQLGKSNLGPDQIERIYGRIAALQKDQITAANEGLNIGSTPTSGGGGEKTDPFKNLMKQIMDTLKMFTNIESLLKKYKGAKNRLLKSIQEASFGGGLADKLRGFGLDERLIDQILSLGFDEAKKVADKLAKNVKQRQVLNQGFIRATAINQTANAKRSTEVLSAQQTAAQKLRQGGRSEELIQFIAGDADKAQTYVGLLKDVKNGYEGAERALRNWINAQAAEQKQSEATENSLKSNVQKAKDDWQQYYDKQIAMMDQQYSNIEMTAYQTFKAMNGMSVEDMQLQIDINNDLIDTYKEKIKAINDEIRAIETRQSRSGNYSEWGLEQLQKEIELTSRNIAQLERQNEMDQRRIDTLRREDELRNRIADALNHDLEIMSNQEEKIRETYQKRIDALDEVAKINDHIVESQKQQLGLAQALSQGDIYAATAAAQEINQTDARFAQEQMRTGLQRGMEGAVAGLRTSGGLTREQAEAQIQSIREQSYQTSLAIRAIEDQIYNRQINEILPLKDREYALNLGLRSVQDQIAAKQLEIRDIERTKIEPITRQNELYQEMLDDHLLNVQIEQSKVKDETGLTRQELERMNNWILAGLSSQEMLSKETRVNSEEAYNLSKQWQNVAEQIKSAKDALKGAYKKIDTTPLSEAYTEAQREADRAAAYAKYVAAVTQALQGIPGIDPSKFFEENKFAGGRIGKYAKGNYVLGSGGRDSVPAMLTPGEFVVRKAMVDKYGIPMLNAINQGAFSLPRYNVGNSGMGSVPTKTEGNANIVAPMYNNYSVNVNVSGTSASADEIANRTIMKIKQMQNMQIRSGRGY